MDSIKNRAVMILTWSLAASFGVFCNMALLVFSLQALEKHREYLEDTIPETAWLLFFIPPLVIAVSSLILGYYSFLLTCIAGVAIITIPSPRAFHDTRILYFMATLLIITALAHTLFLSLAIGVWGGIRALSAKMSTKSQNKGQLVKPGNPRTPANVNEHDMPKPPQTPTGTKDVDSAHIKKEGDEVPRLASLRLETESFGMRF
jgi:hypothetical protein